MEGWRQRRLGSNAKQPTGKKEKTERENALTGMKKKTFLTLTGLLMEGLSCLTRNNLTLHAYS
jgi:hypothetical protein